MLTLTLGTAAYGFELRLGLGLGAHLLVRLCLRGCDLLRLRPSERAAQLLLGRAHRAAIHARAPRLKA